ncbi:MAG: hypothetical protein OSA11_05310 [Candidatus Nanopelagicales bacterium]|nr:hypothetical protein [Candidatus Nanopelagicales bacterium]
MVTKEGAEVSREVVEIVGLDSPNIQFWWNSGIGKATGPGSDVACGFWMPLGPCG